MQEESHMTLRIILYALFALVALIHLYACYFEMQKLRMLTKPMLLLMLALFYVLFANTVRWEAVVAMLLGMVGDIFLMLPNTKRNFLLGAGSFSVGHVFYMLVIYSLLVSTGESFAWWLVVLLALPYAAAIAGAFVRLRKHLGIVEKPGFPLYIGMLGGVGVGSALIMIAYLRQGTYAMPPALMLLGSLLFTVSDIVLSFSLFKNSVKRPNFYVMLTYIGAQCLLCAGLVMI